MINHHLWQQRDSNANGRITLPLSTERCLIWNDPTIGIKWPLEGTPILSAKDRRSVTFDRAAAAIRQVYGNRLVSVVLYGSVGRGTMRHDSDVDLLIIAQDLPRGRMNRVTEFEAVEAAVAGEVEQAHRQGVHTELSLILKTPEEAMAGSPLFLDMIDDARILYDRDGFFARRLALLRERPAQLGIKRLWQGNACIGISSRIFSRARCSNCDQRIVGPKLSEESRRPSGRPRTLAEQRSARCVCEKGEVL